MQFPLPRINDAKDHILTAVLLVLAAALLINQNEGGINAIRKISVSLFSYVETPLSNIRVYRQALKTNTDLRRQNILLLDKLNRLRSDHQQIEGLRKLLKFSRNSDLSLYPIQIIGKELNQVNNIITIDAGSEKGIKEGMPVVTADGLIGKVVLTSPRFSQVMPYFNTLFKVSAKLQKSNAYGILSWDGKNIHQLELKYIPQTIQVDSGETITTSGYSNAFLSDIPIGKVIRTQPDKGKDTQMVFVRPFVDLFTIAEGFVVTTQPDTSLKNLNEQYKGMFK